MQNLLVLGIVPGTNIQITFTVWLNAIAILCGLKLLRYAWQHRADLHRLYVILRIALVIDQGQILA